MEHDWQAWEDSFRGQERKENRKERKLASSKDRSQFKKTDQDQRKKRQEEITFSDDVKVGRVLAITPEGILVDGEETLYLCSLKGSLKQDNMRTKNLVAVGDFVRFLPTPSSNDFQKEAILQGTVLHVEPRRSLLSRADNLSRRKEQLIAVNIDQVLITCAVVEPQLKPALIDRYIIAAQKGRMEPVIIINKIDLLDDAPQNRALYEDFVRIYRSLGFQVLCLSTTTGEGLDTLRRVMQNKTSVFSGQSGVGKSSLINAIVGSDLRTGSLAAKTSKGTHTTTTTHLLPLKGGGFCIDTPGIRSFGVWDLELAELQAYFPEIFELGRHCRYPDCTHTKEPDCAVQEGIETGEISTLRFESYCALMSSLSQEHRHR